MADGTTIDMEVLFLALDKPKDVAKLLSMELTGAWINEAREVPLSILEGATMRVDRFPPMSDGGCTWSGVLMDTNPPDEDHWWYELAEVKRPDDYEFFRQPGANDKDAENLQNLSSKYYPRLSLGKKEEWINVYVNGNYGFVVDGKPVYSEYNDRVHCQEVGFTDGIPVYVGIDFGLTPAAVLGQKPATGQIRCLSEVVTEDMGVKRFSEILKNHINEKYPHDAVFKFFGDPAGSARSQTDEKTVFDILHAQGIKAFPADSNDFTLRRESFATPMTRMIDGDPGFIIHPDCKVLRKGIIGGYHYRRVQVSSSEKYADKPDKGKYSHVCDAGQYMTLGMGEGMEITRMNDYRKPQQRVANMDYDPLDHNNQFQMPRMANHNYDPLG
jgi:hypothetical protein